MYYLLHFDYSKVDLRNPPKTRGLFEQKLESMDTFDRWWMDILQKGYLPCSDMERRSLGYWQKRCSKQDLLNDYASFGRTEFDRTRKGLTSLGMKLSKLVPGLKSTSMQAIFKHPDGDLHEKNVTCYEFPDLDACRAAFEKRIKDKVEWDVATQTKSIEVM